MKAEIEHLILLQHTDNEVRQLESESKGSPQKRAEIEKEFEQRASDFRALELRRDEARTARAALEKELEETRHLAERAERNLMSSKGEKDYGAAIREIDSARKHASQLETKVLEQLEILESTEGELREHAPEISRLGAEREERLRIFDREVQDQNNRLVKARAERERLLATMPRQLSSLYKRISGRIRDGIAVAEVRNGSCSACFMKLRPQTMAEARRGDDIVVCDNCNRILYIVPAEHSAKAPYVSAP